MPSSPLGHGGLADPGDALKVVGSLELSSRTRTLVRRIAPCSWYIRSLQAVVVISYKETPRPSLGRFGVRVPHPHLMWRQVDKSGSVAEKGTPEIPDGSSPGLARAVSWATGGPNVPLCPWLARQAPTFAHVTA